MMRRRTLLAGIAGIALGACGGGGEKNGPPSISYGKETCDRCRMLIAEERHAAALVPAKGEELHFDDVGELVATAQEIGIDDARVWVHDFDTRAWLDATTATYAVDPRRVTPMGTGVIAFANRADAEAYLAGIEGGAVYTWSEVLIAWHIDS